MPLDVGLRAILEPEFDEKKMDDEVEGLEERLEALQGVDVDIDTDRMEGMMEEAESLGEKLDGDLGDAIAGRLGGKAGTLAKGGQRLAGAGAGGGGSKLAAAMGGGGAAATAGGALVGVALGGAVSIGILKGVQKMAGWAPKGRKMVEMFSTAMDLFFRPFGDIIGEAFMPYAKGALQAMAEFNKHFQNDGLAVAVVSLAADIKDALMTPAGAGAAVGTIGGAYAGAKGGAALGATVGSIVPGAGTAIGGTIGGGAGLVTGGLLGSMTGAKGGELLGDFNWSEFINDLSWEDHVVDLLWDDWIVGVVWDDWLVNLTWDTFIVDLYWDTWVVDLFWDTFVTDIAWNSFVSLLEWDTWVGFMEWNEHIGELLWSSFVEDMLWEAFVQNIVWDSFVQNIVWDSFINDIVWDGIITAPNWDSIIPEIKWGEILNGGGGMPWNANGGIVTDETIFGAGEGGDSEAIIPLSRLESMLTRERSAGVRAASAVAEPTENNSRGSDLSSLENQLERLLRAVREMSGETSVEVDGQTLVKQERKSGKQYSDSREVYQ